MKKSSQKSIKVAVVGAGNIGKHHARNLKTMSDTELTAVVDIDKTIGKALSTKYGTKYYPHVQALLKEEHIDAVIVAVPTRLHYSVAKILLETRIPTLIEKPIAANVRQAKNLIKIAKRHDTILFIGHIERFNSAVQSVYKLLQKGEIGEIVSLTAKRVGLFPPRSPDTNVIIDLGVHDIDIFSYLIGQYPTKVYASGGKILLENHEDHAEIFLQYPSGISGYIQLSWITPVKMRSLSVTGTKGYIELDYIKQSIQIVHNHLTDSFFDSYGQFILKSQPTKNFLIGNVMEEPLKLELESFLDSVRGKIPVAIPGEVGLKALEIATKAVKKMQVEKKPGSIKHD